MALQVDFDPETTARVTDAAIAEGMDAATFVREAVAAKLYQNAFALPVETVSESDLLQRIHRGFPETFWNRYRTLIARREAGTLSADEHQELISMSDTLEARAAERLQYLIELSRRRGIPVRQLMEQMDIRPVAVL